MTFQHTVAHLSVRGSNQDGKVRKGDDIVLTWDGVGLHTGFGNHAWGGRDFTYRSPHDDHFQSFVIEVRPSGSSDKPLRIIETRDERAVYPASMNIDDFGSYSRVVMFTVKQLYRNGTDAGSEFTTEAADGNSLQYDHICGYEIDCSDPPSNNQVVMFDTDLDKFVYGSVTDLTSSLYLLLDGTGVMTGPLQMQGSSGGSVSLKVNSDQGSDEEVEWPLNGGLLLADPTGNARFSDQGELNVWRIENMGTGALEIEAGTNVSINASTGTYVTVAGGAISFTSAASSVTLSSGTSLINVDGFLNFIGGYAVVSTTLVTHLCTGGITLSTGVNTVTVSNGLTVSSGNITMAASATVDGRDISADGTSLDSHLSSTSNPHSTKWTNLGETPSSFSSNARYMCSVNSAANAVEHVEWFGTSFPTSDLWDGRPFFRTDLYEWFFYDSNGSGDPRWLGELRSDGFGTSGSVTSGSYLRRYNGMQTSASRGIGPWDYDAVITEVFGNWTTSVSGDFNFRRSGTSFMDINVTSATSFQFSGITVGVASGGLVAFSWNGTGTVSAIQVDFKYRKSIDA